MAKKLNIQKGGLIRSPAVAAFMLVALVLYILVASGFLKAIFDIFAKGMFG